MAQASVSIRMDADLKRQFDEFCSEIGMTMRERIIPFEISAERSDPFYSPENMERLRASIAQMEATGGTVHEVDFNG